MLIILPHSQPTTKDHLPEPLLTKMDQDSLEPVGPSSITPVEEEKPADWAFMEQSGEVLAHLPVTWSAYPKDARGMADIINMEHSEFQTAFSQNMAKEDQMRELVHLASACLYYWRYLNNVK